MNLKKLKIGDLKIATYNPRKELTEKDKEYQKIKNSIIEFGYVTPIIVNSDMTVISGHQRLKVLKDLKYEDIDCIIVDFDKNKEKLLNIALNKISGEWDYQKLESIFNELENSNIDLSITGFEEKEINKLIKETEETMNDNAEIDLNDFNDDKFQCKCPKCGFDFDEVDEMLKDMNGSKEDDFDIDSAYEKIEEPITKPGDIWILGKHRLMCGNSTQKEDVMCLMNKQKADMLLTDPPYNVDYVGKTVDALKIANDNMNDSQFYEFLKQAFMNMFDSTREGASIYVFHADTEGLNFRKAFKDAGFKLAECLIWKKDCFVMGRQDYQWQHEPILYGWKEGAAHYFINDRTQSTILEFDRPKQSALHPTMKPIDLIARLVKNSSKENDIILDLFGGSGSTIITAEQLNRSCYSMELDPKYCDVIVKRWETLTNKEAILDKR